MVEITMPTLVDAATIPGCELANHAFRASLVVSYYQHWEAPKRRCDHRKHAGDIEVKVGEQSQLKGV